jgi:hypothetical protein
MRYIKNILKVIKNLTYNLIEDFKSLLNYEYEKFLS